MKALTTPIMMFTVALIAAQNVQAAPPAQTVSGQEAIRQATSGVLDPKNGDFAGDGCDIEITLSSHTLTLVMKNADTTETTLQISDEASYRLTPKEAGPTISSPDGKESLTVIMADDAFNRVEIKKSGVVSACEQDM